MEHLGYKNKWCKTRAECSESGLEVNGSRGACGEDDKRKAGAGREIKGTFCPRTVFLPLHTPVLRSTSAERFPAKQNKSCQGILISPSRYHFWFLSVLTSDARMEPPIQALNRRSTVVLLAISFSLILCKQWIGWTLAVNTVFTIKKTLMYSITMLNPWLRPKMLILSAMFSLSHRRCLLGEFSVQSVSETLNQRVSSTHHHTAIQAL